MHGGAVPFPHAGVFAPNAVSRRLAWAATGTHFVATEIRPTNDIVTHNITCIFNGIVGINGAVSVKRSVFAQQAPGTGAPLTAQVRQPHATHASALLPASPTLKTLISTQNAFAYSWNPAYEF